MAFFKSRKGAADEPKAKAASAGSRAAQPAESIEAMRRRAKHRLIGASVLVLIGVVGFPLLFDTQPRPISVDIPIEIPDRSKAKPLPAPAPAPAAATTQAPPAPAPSAPAPAPAAAPSLAKAEPKPAETSKPEGRPEAKPANPADDGTKAMALLDGKPVATTPVIAEGRFVVQVGAFADVGKARETRSKLERAGMKTYTQVVDTREGKRIRVRVGPFASKADADKAAQRVKGLELPAAVLTLS